MEHQRAIPQRGYSEDYYLKQKPNETGRHLTISPMDVDPVHNVPNTLWSAVLYRGYQHLISCYHYYQRIIYCGGDGNEWRGRQQIWCSFCHDIARFLRCPRRRYSPDYCEGNRGNYVVRLCITKLRGSLVISYLIGKIRARISDIGAEKLLGSFHRRLITFLIFGLLTLASVLAVVSIKWGPTAILNPCISHCLWRHGWFATISLVGIGPILTIRLRRKKQSTAAFVPRW